MTSNYIKMYSGSSILVNRLNSLLKEANIASIIKDNINSSQMAGFGPLGQSIELYILNSDVEAAKPIIDAYKEKINSL